jgi:hypothetical protein
MKMALGLKKRKSRRDVAAEEGRVRLSGATLAKFAAFAILGLIGAWLTFVLAASGLSRSKSPDRALAFVPWEGTALANKADMSLLSGQKIPAKALAVTARASLRNAPLNPKAVRLLAISAAMDGDEDQASKLVHKAASLTRRDTLTHVFLIEEASRRDDLKTALVHYDLALRTSTIAPQILYPRLLKAIELPEVRAALKPYIRSGEQWTIDFVNFSKDQGKDLTPLVDLMLETDGAPDPEIARGLRANVISALYARQQYAQIARLLRAEPGADRVLTGVGLETLDQNKGFGSAGWQLLNDAEVGATGQVDAKGAAMSIYANPETTRPVARKLLFLSPGRYRFSFKLAPINQGEGSAIGWNLRCAQAKGAVLWRLDGVLTGRNAEWNVGQGCPVQVLEIVATGGRGQTGMEAILSNVSLARSGVRASSSSEEPTADKAPSTPND